MSDTQNGLKLRLEATHTNGLPGFKATITNVSPDPIVFCAYQAEHRLKSRMNADGYEVFVFEPTPRTALAQSDFVNVAPGQSLTYDLEFGKGGYEWLWAGSRPPVVSQSDALKEFPAGTYPFVAHIGDHITFSTAPSGQSGPKERCNIFKDLESSVEVPANCWHGDLVAQCDVVMG